jgi:voltage-gated potassium channel
MPPFLAPIAILLIFFQELWDLVRQPQYRSLLYWILLLLLVGTVFYVRVEGWRPLDSLYFCVISLATVGYGDFSPVTDAGKLFTIFYVLIGFGMLATFLNMLAKERQTIIDRRSTRRMVETDEKESS